MTEDPILQKYRRSLHSVYGALQDELADIAGWPIASTKAHDCTHARRVAAAQCGQRVGAAGKIARRDYLVRGLHEARSSGADITPTVALHVIEKIMGKGGDWRVLLGEFADPSRTAAQKSEAAIEPLAELVSAGMDDFMAQMQSIYKEERSAHLLVLAQQKRG